MEKFCDTDSDSNNVDLFNDFIDVAKSNLIALSNPAREARFVLIVYFSGTISDVQGRIGISFHQKCADLLPFSKGVYLIKLKKDNISN